MSVQREMAPQSNEEKAVAVLRAFVAGDTAAIEQLISPDRYIQHSLRLPSGRDALLKWADRSCF